MEETHHKKLKGSYFSYALLYGSYYFGMGIFVSILSVYLSGTGKTAKEISLIVSANGIFSMALQPIIGMIYDRMQREKQISFILLALSAAFGVSFAFLKNTILLFLFNGFAMSLLNSINPVCERRALATRYSYGTIRIWAAIGYANAPRRFCSSWSR